MTRPTEEDYAERKDQFMKWSSGLGFDLSTMGGLVICGVCGRAAGSEKVPTNN